MVCVNRLHPSTTAEMISDFLQSSGIDVVSCYLLNREEQVQRKFTSVWLCVPQPHLAKILDHNFWPSSHCTSLGIQRAKELLVIYRYVQIVLFIFLMDTLRVLSLNCHGFNNSTVAYVHRVCTRYNVDILFLQETWLTDANSHIISLSLIHI